MPYSEQDRAIFASLRRENEYWKSVGGHPDAGHMDADREDEEAPAFVLKRARSPQELAEARAQLIHAGYSQCGACGTWSNEDMRCDAHGSAHDSRCPKCGVSPSMLVEE